MAFCVRPSMLDLRLFHGLIPQAIRPGTSLVRLESAILAPAIARITKFVTSRSRIKEFVISRSRLRNFVTSRSRHTKFVISRSRLMKFVTSRSRLTKLGYSLIISPIIIIIIIIKIIIIIIRILIITSPNVN